MLWKFEITVDLKALQKALFLSLAEGKKKLEQINLVFFKYVIS